jgi:hypothetical protein
MGTSRCDGYHEDFNYHRFLLFGDMERLLGSISLRTWSVRLEKDVRFSLVYTDTFRRFGFF